MKMLSACLLLLPFISCTQVQDTKNDAVIEQKIEALLSRMTLEEKIGQMNQISSYGNIEDMSGLIKKGEVGSILNEVDPVRVNALQRVAMEESRLGIPLLMARDVIHGFKTIFPIPLGQAASFNPQVAKDGARVAAVEASAVGIRWTFAPMIDVARDPRCGDHPSPYEKGGKQKCCHPGPNDLMYPVILHNKECFICLTSSLACATSAGVAPAEVARRRSSSASFSSP